MITNTAGFFAIGLGELLKETFIFHPPDETLPPPADLISNLKLQPCQSHQRRSLFASLTRPNSSDCSGFRTPKLKKVWKQKVGTVSPIDRSFNEYQKDQAGCTICCSASIKVTSQLTSIEYNLQQDVG
ncbi:hypothetical protein ACSQ67_020691 [Phaseolus vulgaris]